MLMYIPDLVEGIISAGVLPSFHVKNSNLFNGATEEVSERSLLLSKTQIRASVCFRLGFFAGSDGWDCFSPIRVYIYQLASFNKRIDGINVSRKVNLGMF